MSPPAATATPSAAGRSGRVAALVLAPGGVLVAVVLLVLRLNVEPLAIPPYSIAAGAPTQLAPGSTYTLEIDPKGALTGAIAAHGFLMRGNEVRQWEPLFAVDKDGTMHVQGPVDTLFKDVPAGAWDLYVVVGRPELMPRSLNDALKGLDAGAGPSAWTLLHQSITLGH